MATKEFEIPIEGGTLAKEITNPARYDAAQTMLLFSSTITEAKLFKFDVPGDYVGSPQVRNKFSMASDNSNNVDWNYECWFVADATADHNIASFDTVNASGAVAVPGTLHQSKSETTNLANDDGMAAGGTLYLRVSRDHDSGNDDASGDAEGVSLFFVYSDA